MTAEEQPQAIKRYAHVPRAGGWNPTPCGSRLEGTARLCTRERGHSGPHVAHGAFRRILAVWDAAGGSAASRRLRGAHPEHPAPKRPRRRPVGLPSRAGDSASALRTWLSRTLASAEEIAFLVFFLAFVGFAIYWLSLILG